MDKPQNLLIFQCFFLSLLPFFYTSSSTFSEMQTYIIHMDSSSIPSTFSNHHDWYLSILSSITTEADTIKHVYSYTNAIHGFSAVVSPAQLQAIKNSPGYLYSIKDMKVKPDTTHSYQFLGLNSNNGAWPVSNYGGNVIIGVVDSGVWPESDSFKDDGMTEIPSRWKGRCESGENFNSSTCNKKLIGARYFNKGLLANDPSLKISMNSARDTDGHGTHTSSTAAGSNVGGASFFGYASGTAIGMAPRARLAVYKALWDEGAAVSDIIAAIDEAITDGVDVISLSLGLDNMPLYDDPVAIAAFAAMERGIFVATSAGNAGPTTMSLHNGTPWVLTVAAGTVDREFRGILTLGNGVSVAGQSLYVGNYSHAQLPLVFIGACDDYVAAGKLRRRAAVCVDTRGYLEDQIYFIENSKPRAAVFISNATDFTPYVKTRFPALLFDPGEGRKIMDYITGVSDPKASFRFGVTATGTKQAPKLAEYSSRGPSASCPYVLKPDIMAPGDLILASWPSISYITEIDSRHLFNNFNVISGTSMSCPHAAGVAALLKAAHPDWSPAMIRSAMMTTANELDNTNNPVKDNGAEYGDTNGAATPLGMGAGHLNPNNALNPGLVYNASSQDYINLLCALNFTGKQLQAIIRSTPYDCSNPSLDLNYPSFIAYFNNTLVKEFQRSVTNVGDDKSVYIAKLPVLEGLRVSIDPNKLEFNEKYEKKSYKLRLEGPKLIKQDVIHGALTWVEANGKYRVRSPIVVTTLTRYSERLNPL